jgi:hypothetical protein
MADTPAYRYKLRHVHRSQGRLWLMWPRSLPISWEIALDEISYSTNYLGNGAPVWSVSEVLHVTPGQEFPVRCRSLVEKGERRIDTLRSDAERAGAQSRTDLRKQANDN